MEVGSSGAERIGLDWIGLDWTANSPALSCTASAARTDGHPFLSPPPTSSFLSFYLTHLMLPILLLHLLCLAPQNPRSGLGARATGSRRPHTEGWGRACMRVRDEGVPYVCISIPARRLVPRHATPPKGLLLASASSLSPPPSLSLFRIQDPDVSPRDAAISPRVPGRR